MRTLLFRCADSGRLVSALQVDEKTFNDETIDIFTGPLAHAKVHGRLEGVTALEVAETYEPDVKPEHLVWYPLPASYL